MNMQDIRFDIKNFEGKKIVVFGDMMIDEYLDGDVSRISPEAPVPVVHVQKCTKRLGGAGNVVRNLKALGADVSAVSYMMRMISLIRLEVIVPTYFSMTKQEAGWQSVLRVMMWIFQAYLRAARPLQA